MQACANDLKMSKEQICGIETNQSAIPQYFNMKDSHKEDELKNRRNELKLR